MLIIGKMLYTWSPELIYPFKKKNYDPSLVISHFPLLPGPDSHLLLSDCMNLTALSCTSGTTWHLFFNDPSWFNLLEDRAKGWIAAGRGTQPNIEPNPNFTLVILQPPADMTQQRKKSEQQSITKKNVISPLDIREVDTTVPEDLSFPKSRTIWGWCGGEPSLAAFFLVALSCTTVGRQGEAHQTCPHLLWDGLGLGWGSW